ncbi:chitinase 10-like 8, partial [Homarus americanus]
SSLYFSPFYLSLPYLSHSLLSPPLLSAPLLSPRRDVVGAAGGGRGGGGRTFLAKQHDPWLDNDLKNYDKFTQLKNKKPDLKVLLGLGGWNDSRSNKYTRLVADAGLRRKFVEEVVKLLLQYNFDGLDLDWEYPGYEGSPSDKQGFTAWLEDLKSAFRPHNLLLTSAVSAGRRTIDRGYDIPKVAKLLDLIHLMSYDFHGSWENKVAHHSPLYAEAGQNPELCTDFAVNYWIKKGAPAHKIVIGVPLYGRSWTLAGAENFPGAAARGPGQQGRYIKASGNMAFFECCLAHQKAEYVASRGLGGIMVWDTATDDFGNYCGLGHNPLLTAIAKTLNGSTTSTSLTSLDRRPSRPQAGSSQKLPPGNEKTKGVGSHGKQDTINTAGTNTIGGGTSGRKNSNVERVKNNRNNVETTTKLFYPWQAPFFSQANEKKQDFNSISPTAVSRFTSRPSSSSYPNFKLIFTTTTPPPLTPSRFNFQSPHSFSPSRFTSRPSSSPYPDFKSIFTTTTPPLSPSRFDFQSLSSSPSKFTSWPSSSSSSSRPSSSPYPDFKSIFTTTTPPSTPSRFNSQSSSSSYPNFKLIFTTTTTTTPPAAAHSSFAASSSSSSGVSWFADCNALGFAPDPLSCNTFYRCTNNYAYKFDCPGGLLWHQDQSSCDWPDAVQCILPLTPPDIQHFLPPHNARF